MSYYRGFAGKVKDAEDALKKIRRCNSYLRTCFKYKKPEDINLMIFEDGEWILTDVEKRGRSHLQKIKNVPIMLHAHKRSVQLCHVRRQRRWKYYHEPDKNGKMTLMRELIAERGVFTCSVCYKPVPDKPRFFHQLKEAEFK